MTKDRSAAIFNEKRKHDAENQHWARKALAEPGRYPWLVDWARIVMERKT